MGVVFVCDYDSRCFMVDFKRGRGVERTKTSNWVYRATCAAMIAGNIFVLQRITQIPALVTNAGDLLPDVGSTQIVFLSGYLGLFFAAVALLKRSGAVIWLIAVFGLFKSASPLVVFRDDGYFASVRFDPIAGCLLVVVLPILFWLVKKQEIRQP